MKAKIMRQLKLLAINKKIKPKRQYLKQQENQSVRINTFGSPSKLIHLSFSDWGDEFQ